MDLFEPGSGSQLHDFNADIAPSGLFWTVRIPDSALTISDDGRRASLRLKDWPLVDSLQFFGPKELPARLSVSVRWTAVTRTVRHYTPRGSTARNFTADFLDASATGSFSGSSNGFGFNAPIVSSRKTGWAEMGAERNGRFA